MRRVYIVMSSKRHGIFHHLEWNLCDGSVVLLFQDVIHCTFPIYPLVYGLCVGYSFLPCYSLPKYMSFFPLYWSQTLVSWVRWDVNFGLSCDLLTFANHNDKFHVSLSLTRMCACMHAFVCILDTNRAWLYGVHGQGVYVCT